MQVLFSKFHNRIVDWLREKGTAEQTLFSEARRLVVWHYQWIISREFLPEVIGDGLTGERDEIEPLHRPLVGVRFCS
jgi:hypothetical protein